MSLASLPIETITHIFNLLDESDLETPLDVDEHREVGKALMALRLTCKELDGIATGQLFRRLYLSSSRDSWLNLHTVAANPKFCVHLQTLTLEGVDDWANFELKMADARKSPELFFLDFSSFPNLKVLEAGNKWIIRKKPRSNVQIPRGTYGICLSSYWSDQPAIWRILGDLENITLYGFDLFSLQCELGEEHWISQMSIDLRNLTCLTLHSDGAYSYEPHLKANADLDRFELLKNLPNLEEFHLDQYFTRRSDNSPGLDTMTNVLKHLANGKNWPRLRHLDLQYLITTVEDFKAFMAPHAAGSALKTFEMHGNLICAQATDEEKEQRVDLPRWIRTRICLR